ncbi:ATP sulfurylase 2 [Artemisia annua]|uniref:ATP sulfurylase 2 n=1 Tax=Artemisia annua TaxID=35608 RepID=A0A2U1PZG8_ARTAN|nr:ATP sulfurylase 2 [Artemisia annua]
MNLILSSVINIDSAVTLTIIYPYSLLIFLTKIAVTLTIIYPYSLLIFLTKIALRYTSITKSFGVSIEIYKHNKEERIARTWGTTAPGLSKVEEVITPAGN